MARSVAQRVISRKVDHTGLHKVAAPAGSPYPVWVLTDNLRPVSHLIEWYSCRSREPGTSATRDTYLDMLLVFEAWRCRKRYAWHVPPDNVRAHVREFFQERLSCRVVRDFDRDGYLIKLSGQTPLSSSSVGVLLAAVANLYEILIAENIYAYDNPLQSQNLRQWRQEYTRHIANAGAPEHAGIRGESWEQTGRRSISYFRTMNAVPWTPKLASQSAQEQQKLQDALHFMIRHAAEESQRDKVVLLLLWTTGARLNEIVGLTVGGYRKADHPYQAIVTNKGSDGLEVKRIYFPAFVYNELVKYIRNERIQHDPHGRGHRWPDGQDTFLPTDPIFLSENGTPYNSDAFRYHWRKLAQRARRYYRIPHFRIHDIRHLYVTQNRRKNKQIAGGDAVRENELNRRLSRRMAWRSYATMAVYDHSDDVQDDLEQVASWHEEIERQIQVTPRKSLDDDTNVQGLSEDRNTTEVLVVDDPDGYIAAWDE